MENPKITGGENREAMFLGSARYNVQVFDRRVLEPWEPIEGGSR